MVHIEHYCFAGLLLLLIGCKSNTQSKQEEETVAAHPNIVVIYMDDLGYGDMSAYGATEISTPHMDRLANEGIQIGRAHV